MPELQTYQMAGVLMPTARFVQLIPTGEYHDGIEVVEPRDVTLYVEALQSAWDKKQDLATEAVAKLHARIAELEAQMVPRPWVDLTADQVDAITKPVCDEGPHARWRVASALIESFKEANSAVKVLKP